MGRWNEKKAVRLRALNRKIDAKIATRAEVLESFDLMAQRDEKRTPDMTEEKPVYGLWVGSKMIHNILDPQPDEIDLDGIEASLWNTHRFSNDPNALLVRQHTGVVEELAAMAEEPFEVIQWAWHHDDHEGVTGDIPGPLGYLMASDYTTGGRIASSPLFRVQLALDVAICAARDIPVPTTDTRARVHYYDKLAETMEWRFALGRPTQAWNVPIPEWLPHHKAEAMIWTALGTRRPEKAKE